MDSKIFNLIFLFCDYNFYLFIYFIYKVNNENLHLLNNYLLIIYKN